MLNDRNNSREKMLRAVQTYGFCVYDALLYLDAYPNCKEALDYYNKYKRLECKARADYEQKYGPLTVPMEAHEWNWTNGPWPWQLEGDNK